MYINLKMNSNCFNKPNGTMHVRLYGLTGILTMELSISLNVMYKKLEVRVMHSIIAYVYYSCFCKLNNIHNKQITNRRILVNKICTSKCSL